MVRSEDLQGVMWIDSSVTVEYKRSTCPGIPWEVPPTDDIDLVSVQMRCGFKFSVSGRLANKIEEKLWEKLDQ